MKDIIYRADVLKYPIRLNHYDELNGTKEFVLGIESVLEYVEALPSADVAQGWIPVSERLPKDNRPVLIYAWNVHHVVARYGQFRAEDDTYKETWVTADAWNGNTEIKDKVIAWMPLPEPYKRR